MRLTKTELRLQQLRLNQLQKYLPTLQLKKTLLQLEVNNAQLENSFFLSIKIRKGP
jgi:V/A-type H+-transporting ATPase subunit D